MRRLLRDTATIVLLLRDVMIKYGSNCKLVSVDNQYEPQYTISQLGLCLGWKGL